MIHSRGPSSDLIRVSDTPLSKSYLFIPSLIEKKERQKQPQQKIKQDDYTLASIQYVMNLFGHRE